MDERAERAEHVTAGTGSFADRVPADVLTDLARVAATGALHYDGERRGVIHLRFGALYVGTSERGVPLEAVLAERGEVGRGQWEDAVRRAGDEPRVGEELIQAGTTTRSALELVLYGQLLRALLELLPLRDGSWRFAPGEHHPVGPVVTFPTEAVLAEARTHLVSIEAVLRVVPSVHLPARPVPRLPGGQADVRLSDEEWELLMALGPGRTVAEVAVDLGRSQYAVSRVLVPLVDHGLVVVGPED
jgi:hypothetical protein